MTTAQQVTPTKSNEANIAKGTPITPAKWVRANLLWPLFGITPGAAEKNRERGDWLEGKHWRRNPKGNIVYNWHAIDEWNEGK